MLFLTTKDKKLMRRSGTVMSLVSVALAVPVVFGSCSEDNGLTPTDKGDGNTTSFLDGQIDPCLLYTSDAADDDL